MQEIFFLIEEDCEDGFHARALGAAIFTQADSLEELREQIKEAVACHFEDDEAPKIIRLHIVREEVMVA